MKIFVLLAFVAAASAANPTPYTTRNGATAYYMKLPKVNDRPIDRAWDNEFDSFILNGTYATPGQFPHVARIRIDRTTTYGTCTGSLISTNYV